MVSRNIVFLSTVTKNFSSVARSFSTSPCAKARRRQRINGPRPTGSRADSLFAQDDVEHLEALEDFINCEETQGHGRRLEDSTAYLMKRHTEHHKQALKKTILERKFFKQPQEVNLLTWNAKQQIRYLNSEFPEEWTPERLAESFPVSVEGVHKILNTSFKPRTEEEIVKHDKRVAAHWKKLKKTLVIEGGPVESQDNMFQHVTDTGKLSLMINAAGSSHLPLPRPAVGMCEKGPRKMGVFESIVAGSNSVQNHEEQARKSKVRQQAESKKLLRDIAGSGQKPGDPRSKMRHIENHASSYQK